MTCGSHEAAASTTFPRRHTGPKEKGCTPAGPFDQKIIQDKEDINWGCLAIWAF